MKYYTKEWYNLMQHCDYTLNAKKIPDKLYSEEEIRTFCDKALKKWINRMQKDYNTPPDNSADIELLEECDFDPEEWILIDEEKGIEILPKSKEEVRAFYEAKRKREEEEYRNREPFDPAQEAADFKSIFRSWLENVGNHFPQWAVDQVDLRLLALKLLPQSVYDQLKQEERQNRKELKKMDKRANNAVWETSSNLPERIRINFGFHDASVLAFHKKNKDYEMFLNLDETYFKKGDASYERVLFQGATLLEKDKGIIPHPYQNDGKVYSDCRYLYDEIYGLSDGRYEVHMMVHGKDLKYIILQCEDIQFEDFIEYPKLVCVEK